MTGRRRAGSAALAAAVPLALQLGGCGGDAAPSAQPTVDPPTRASTEPSLSGDLTVFAAASLTDVFTELGAAFTEAHPDVTVSFNFAGSSSLAQQIVAGAPADVFAAASPATMQVVEDAGDAVDPIVFVSNTLEIAVPPGNPAGVSGLADFADADLTIALCAPEVPCGAAAEEVFEVAGVTPAPDTLEQDVRAALSKVQLGEVDAALVYRTDVIAAGDGVEGIEFPQASQAVNDYPVTVLGQAPNPDAAGAFVGFVRSPEAQLVLSDAGFDTP